MVVTWTGDNDRKIFLYLLKNTANQNIDFENLKALIPGATTVAIGRRLQRLREEAKALGVAASDGENGVDADAGAEEGTGDVEKVGAKAAGGGKKGRGRPKKDAGGGKGGSKRKMLDLEGNVDGDGEAEEGAGPLMKKARVETGGEDEQELVVKEEEEEAV